MKQITIEEAIEQLQQLQKENPGAIMIAKSDNFELNGALVPIWGFHKMEGIIEVRPFRDAFDGTNYTTEVISTYFPTTVENTFVKEKKKQAFIKVSA